MLRRLYLVMEKNGSDVRPSLGDLPVPINDQIESELEMKKVTLTSYLQNKYNNKEEKKFWFQLG